MQASSSSSYLQLQLSPYETRLTDTAETFCTALHVADDFLLEDYPHVSSSRHVGKDYDVADDIDNAYLQTIAALKEENNKLKKENEELRERVASICRYPGKFPNSDYCDPGYSCSI